MIEFHKDILQNVESASSREWLETNGIGGFASSTVIGLNTRRYHGLLTAALYPPAGRVVLLSKLEESLVIDGQRHDLSANQYTGAIYPEGYSRLEEFRLDPFPICTYVADGVELQRTMFMVHGQNTTAIQYHVRGQNSRAVHLEVRPLIAFRDYHSLTHENGGLDRSIQVHSETLFSVRPYHDLPNLYFAHDADGLNAQGYWYKHFEYAIERERGLDFVEDLFNPCTLRFDLTSRDRVSIIASTEIVDIRSADAFRRQEIDRRTQLTTTVHVE